MSSIWRYPLKSAMGEVLEQTHVGKGGLDGDRLYALVEKTMNKPLSAKRIPSLFEFSAKWLSDSAVGDAHRMLEITLPDGSRHREGEEGLDELLSHSVGKPVQLKKATEENQFFDDAPVHLLTTATLNWLAMQAPNLHFSAARFRPNFLIDTGEENSLVDQTFIGYKLRIGHVRLYISGPCERCVMTTLPQEDLAHEPGVLKTVVDYAESKVGVYARVEEPGSVCQGDDVYVET